MPRSQPLLTLSLPTLKHLSRGKVREMYDLGKEILIVTSDRISAFDVVLPTGIPHKGTVLNQISDFWFSFLEGTTPHHRITVDFDRMPGELRPYELLLRGRTMLARKAVPFPIECVVRGYLAGSGWKDYQKTGTVCGIPLPPGLPQVARLPEVIFTPATKARSGHDENIDFATMSAIVGAEAAAELRRFSIELYRRGAAVAERAGIIVADTKFEFGRHAGRIHLVDEVLTPDSSRFWPADRYAPGQSPPSYDKQFVRDWLEGTSWDKNSPPPPLPAAVVARTRDKYLEALVRLTGRALD